MVRERERTVAPRRFSSPVFYFLRERKKGKKENFKKKMELLTFLVMFVFGQQIRYSTTAVPNMLTLWAFGVSNILTGSSY